MLELIHKRVGWKLADEDLQGEKRQRGGEKGRDRQMERGRDRVENRAEDAALFHSLALPCAKRGGLCVPRVLPCLHPVPLFSPAVLSPAAGLALASCLHNSCAFHTRGIPGFA